MHSYTKTCLTNIYYISDCEQRQGNSNKFFDDWKRFFCNRKNYIKFE